MSLAVMAVGVAGIALWRGRGEDRRPGPVAASVPAADAGGSGRAVAPGPGPIAPQPLPRLPPDPGGPEPAPSVRGGVAFAQEARDDAWAVEHERELTLRLRGIVAELAGRAKRVDIDAIECRRTQCQVTVHARDAAALGALYGALESPAGLIGWADNLLLAPVETAADGQVTTQVTATFERD